MFNIPKFAKGGLLTPPSHIIGDMCEDKDIISCAIGKDKFYEIYKRTKKARVKKKAAKKSWKVKLKRELEKPITITIGGK